jgi:hypothetical protein
MNAKDPVREQHSEGSHGTHGFTHRYYSYLQLLTHALVAHGLLHVVLTLPFCTTNAYLFKLIYFVKYTKVQQVGSQYVARMNDAAYNNSYNNNINNNSVA